MNERQTGTTRTWYGAAVGRTRDANRCIGELLIGLGVAPHLKGYDVLCRGIRVLSEADRTRRIRINEDLYPLLGETRTQAEHAVRDAIRVAWARKNAARTDLPFGAEPPTAAAFLCTLAECVRDQLSEK